MGYKEGGLGINEQGIIKPTEVIMRPKFLVLGYKNYNKTANVTALQETSDENKALSQLSEKRKTKLTVKESRLAKLDMQIRECELNNEREKVVGLRKEKERLVMEVIGSALGQLNNDSHSGNLSLELLGDLFRRFKRWDPLIKPTDHIDVISVWKDRLQGDDINSPHAQLFIEVVFCAVNRSSTNTWQTTSPEPLLHFLVIWERLTPHTALQKILATKNICSSRRMFISYRKVTEPKSMFMRNRTTSKIE
nr:hypothetical protein [Tanacetum cinerariifolium]